MFNGFVVRYALAHIYHGDHEKFAKALGFSTGEYNAMQKRIDDGKGSPKLESHALELLIADPQVMLNAISAYQAHSSPAKKCRYIADIDQAKLHFTKNKQRSAQEASYAHMWECGDEFAKSIKVALCSQQGDNCVCVQHEEMYEPPSVHRTNTNSRPCYYLRKIAKLLGKIPTATGPNRH